MAAVYDYTNDIVEIIVRNESGEITPMIYKNKSTKKAEKVLQTLSAGIRLDMHNVLDLLNDDEQFTSAIKDSGVCVISFVGLATDGIDVVRSGTESRTIRDKTRASIIKRIENEQIDFGIMVFGRGRGPTRGTYTIPGSKAWINKCLKPIDSAIFVDDGQDHCKSTTSLQIAGLEVYNFSPDEDLHQVLKNFVSKHNVEKS